MLKARTVAACRSRSSRRQTRLGIGTASKKPAAGDGVPGSMGSSRYQVIKDALNAAKGVVNENLTHANAT